MTLYLIRHADAGKRDPYSSSDNLRQLSADGRRQAQRIADRLAGAGVNRVFSSPYPRCIQTVQPLAQRAGVEVELRSVLAEGGDEHKVLDLMTELADTNAVLCSHGDVIPEVIRLLLASGVLIGELRGNAKGSVWTITTEGGTPVAAEYAKTPRHRPGLVVGG